MRKYDKFLTIGLFILEAFYFFLIKNALEKVLFIFKKNSKKTAVVFK